MIQKTYRLTLPFRGEKKLVEILINGQKVELPFTPQVFFPLEMSNISIEVKPIPQSLFVASIDDIERAKSARNIKIKITHLNFEDGLILVRKTLNQTFAKLRIDPNRSLTKDQLIQLNELIPSDRLDYFEEPLERITDALDIPTKFAIDESLLEENWELLISHPNVVAAVVKPYRVFWRPIYERCVKENKRFILSSTLEDPYPILKLANLLNLYEEPLGIDVERFKLDCIDCPIANANPEKIAIVENGQQISYKELDLMIKNYKSDLDFDSKSLKEQILHIFSVLRSGEDLTFEEVINSRVEWGTIPKKTRIFLKTSGTTKDARSIFWYLEDFLQNIYDQLEQLGELKGKKTRICLSLKRMGGLSALVRALVSEGTIIIDTTTHVDYTSLVPTQVIKLLGSNEPILTKKIILGGGKPFSDLASKLRMKGIDLHIFYSSTELGTCIIDGKQIKGVASKVDEFGRLRVQKKHKACELEIDADGYYSTNDTAIIQKDQIVITGRIDRTIISGGEKIDLEEIQQLLSSRFDNTLFFCFGIDDDLWGEALCIAYSSSVPLTHQDVLDYIKSNYPRHFVPKRIFPLPLSQNEKPSLKELKQMAFYS